MKAKKGKSCFAGDRQIGGEVRHPYGRGRQHAHALAANQINRSLEGDDAKINIYLKILWEASGQKHK